MVSYAPVQYVWVITKDFLAESDKESRVGTYGPGGRFGGYAATEEDRDKCLKEGRLFRIRDDDGELYYEGRILTHPDEIGGECDFGPLDDFARANDGATSIWYKNGNSWEEL